MCISDQSERNRVAVPKGLYLARLVAVHPFRNAYEDRFKFDFTITAGENTGKTVSRSTSAKLSGKGQLSELLRDLTGRDALPGEDRDNLIRAAIGSDCQIYVGEIKHRSGVTFSNVETVLPLAD